jgi:thiol-disulfide isomerase/thioredoxin
LNAKSFVYAILMTVLPAAQQLSAQDKPRYALPDEPSAAWGEVQKALLAMHEKRAQKPNEEQAIEFQKQMRQIAVSLADKEREFIDRFPTNENVGEARVMFVHALTHAVAAGDTNAEAQIAIFVSAVLADTSIPEDDRVGPLLYSGNTAVMKKAGMRMFTEGRREFDAELETAGIETTRAALKRFPTNSLLFTLLVASVQRATGERQKELANEIINAPGAPPGVKTLAKHILEGTKPYEIGKPLDIRFTALDGREVDLAKLKGKVVLVEFWSTSCGPCIAEMPTVKAVYEKFHNRGFEVVAISLDDKESGLRRFIKEKELPWPQHFDGKGWGNEFGVRYGIFSIPTMWLVDKEGKLRYAQQAWFSLEQIVASLLGEQSGAPK